jgi:hypothetical protein
MPSLVSTSGLSQIRKLALRNGIRLGFGNVAFDVERGVVELRFCLCELGFRLIEHGLKRTRVDLKEHVVLVNEGAFPKILLDQVPADLRLDLRIHISVERRYPFAMDADIRFDHTYDLYLRGPRRRGLLLGASSAQE